ncbi:MAG: hypothetical protein GX197_06890 [Firmicutes bacterium]|nr:hypothetical protein [Bacillota bacterium]
MMMKNCRGATLIWLLFIVSLFLLLGSALITLAHSDWRVSGHLWAATQARYAAEAGIELALSVLGPNFLQLETEGWTYTRTEEPVFTVQAFRKDERSLSLKAVGSAGGITETMEVLAFWRPLGRQGLRGRKVTLKEVTVHGHVLCEQLTFSTGHSHIYGNLSARQIYGGGEEVFGHRCREGMPYRSVVNFMQLADQAQREGWQVVICEEEIYPVEKLPDVPLFVAGDAEICLGQVSTGVCIALGNIYIKEWTAGAHAVILAAGNIIFPHSGGIWTGSLIAYSGEKIIREGQLPLQISGALVAEELILEKTEIIYDDEAIFSALNYLPETLFTLQPGFDLEWLDVNPRR